MDTPIYDFVRRYAASGTLRLHMPGHKGVPYLGCEPWDLTEVAGADALYEAEGIIRQSEENAAALFGSGRSLYSTEGASQCIRAMVLLALQHRPPEAAPRFLAARNAHRSFLSACALCGAEADWLYPEAGGSLLSCPISPKTLARRLDASERPYAGVYVTSPDYLGGMADLAGLAAVCQERGLPLLVDNAHGAYLRFLPESGAPGSSRPTGSGRPDCISLTGENGAPGSSRPTGSGAVSLHPLDLGADLVCDSAHKTLPVLTGGAYLHLSVGAASRFPGAKAAMALFGSTSPSYLILASLDRCNALLAGDWPEKLAAAAADCAALRRALRLRGWTLGESDPLRVTVLCDGRSAAARLRAGGMEPEYAGPEALVLMLTPENAGEALARVPEALGEADLPSRPAPPLPPAAERVCGLREALLGPQELLSPEAALGRICGTPTVGCPPAVPIAVAGERLSPAVLPLLRYYGLESVSVLRG